MRQLEPGTLVMALSLESDFEEFISHISKVKTLYSSVFLMNQLCPAQIKGDSLYSSDRGNLGCKLLIKDGNKKKTSP